MRDVFQCLVEELQQYPVDSKAYQVLRFMAEDKLRALDNGRNEPLTYERPALMAGVVGANQHVQMNPARWLMAGKLEHYMDSIMPSLSQRLRAAGLNHKPAVRKDNERGGAGKQLTYWLDTEPLDDEYAASTSEIEQLSVRYQRSNTGAIEPSWLFRLIFNKGELKNRSHRGYWLIGSVVFTLLLLALWLGLALFGQVNRSNPLTLGQIINLALLASGAWLVWAQFGLPWIRLVDHRVLKAPLLALSWKEVSAELEMHRDSEGNQWTRFVRFSAECPICSGKIELLPGKPEHRLPLVGRCAESPHAHVYSFDRTQLTGYYIGPRLQVEGV